MSLELTTQSAKILYCLLLHRYVSNKKQPARKVSKRRKLLILSRPWLIQSGEQADSTINYIPSEKGFSLTQILKFCVTDIMGPLRSTGRSKPRPVGHPLAFAEDFGPKASVFPLGDFTKICISK